MSKLGRGLISYRLWIFALLASMGLLAVFVLGLVGTASATPSGLVSYWRANGDATDAFGNNNGTLQDGAGFAAGKIGQAFSLDGDNDYVSAPSTGVPVGDSPRTVKLWIKPDASSVAADQNTIFFYGTPSLRKSFGIDMDGLTASGNVKIQVFTWADDINGLDTGVPPGNFMHIAVTYDGGTTLKAYVNGQLKATHTLGGVLDTGTSDINIGRFSTAFFEGLIDEVKIYNTAHTAGEIKAQYDKENSGLVSLWPAEGDADDIIDGNNGTLLPVNNGATANTPGVFGTAFSFDGVDDHVLIPDSANLNPTSAITIAAWVQVTAQQGLDRDIISKDGELFDRQYLLTASSANKFRAHIGVSSFNSNCSQSPVGLFHFFDGATDVQLNQWYHVAMTYDGSSLKLYVNGVLDGSCSASGSIITTTQPVRIGGGAPSGDPLHFQGLIDEVELFNRALTACEVAVNALVACTPPLIAYIANLTSDDVSVVDVANGNVIATIPIPGGSGGVTQLVASPDGSRVYTTDSSHLHTIATATNTVVGTLSLLGAGGAFPSGIAVSPDGSRVYVTQYSPSTNSQGVVSVVATATNSVIHTITAVGEVPEGVGVTPDGNRLYVSNGGGPGSDQFVRVYDTTVPTFPLLGTINVGLQARDLAISPDGARVYVTIQSAPMFIKEIDISAGLGSVIDTITLNMPCCPGSVVVNPTSDRIYLGNHGGARAIDPATNGVVLITGTQSQPVFLDISDDGSTVVAANQSSNSVSVIDTATNAAVSTITVGSFPQGVALIGGPVNHAPKANAGSDQTIEWTGGSVSLDGTGSSDVDGDGLTYSWSFIDQPGGSTATLTNPTGATPSFTPDELGDYVVQLVVNDGEFNSQPDTVTITVQDTTAPAINGVTASPDKLWPPNHKMREVTVTVDVSDACDDDVSCKIVSVTGNDGATASDADITDGLTVDLRAERSGKGDGRSYTITVECTDDTGNSSQSTVQVKVPHDQGKKK